MSEPSVHDERLRTLSARLEALAAAPVEQHPETLDEVHRTLVRELDTLADAMEGLPLPR